MLYNNEFSCLTHSNLTNTTIKKVNTDFIVIPDIIIKILNISELLDGDMKKRIWANNNNFLQWQTAFKVQL